MRTILALVLAFLSTAMAEDVVTTGPATDVNATSATISGTVIPGRVMVSFFRYGTKLDNFGGIIGSSVRVGNSTDIGYTYSYSHTLTGLNPNTTYHYRIYTSYSNGAIASFTTKAISPTVATGAVGSLTASTASVTGTMNANNSPTVDSVQYGTTTSYGMTIPASPATSMNHFETPISAALSGLLPNTTYHYRVKAVNEDGTDYGADATFTTACGLSGAGTEASPYLVGNYADLQQVGVRSCALSASYRQTSDIDASPSAAQDSGFAPIGWAGTPFSGAYHGAGHVIAHLTIKRTLRDSVGLFTHLGRSATVDSLVWTAFRSRPRDWREVWLPVPKAASPMSSRPGR